MKKKLKSELVSLAHAILQTHDSVSYTKLAAQAQDVANKLGILAYAEQLEIGDMPTIGVRKIEDQIRKIDETLLTHSSQKTIVEEVKVEVEQPPVIAAEAEKEILEDETLEHKNAIDQVMDQIEATDSYVKNDVLEIGNEYAQTLVFEPLQPDEPSTDEAFIEKMSTPVVDKLPEEAIQEKQRRINNTLNGQIKVGLNDRIAFVNQLFAGNNADYNRVLSQVMTKPSYETAQHFISEMIKPDYNHWEGKEAVEERFMQVIFNFFE